MATKTKKTTKKAGGRKKAAKKAAPRRAAGAKSAAGKHLVIVESPAKARTINKYLGPDYVVLASVGHVRDLPKRNPKGVKAPVPGVDIERDFKPTYEVISGKAKTVTDLKRAARAAADIWLATDLDREGEAIAWHLAEALGVPTDQAKRVVFNSITKEDIQQAFKHPRPLNMDKVNAQQARRILDRIVGYQVSPLLWKKVAGGLSAGRVQSVAVRLIAEREKEIRAFIPEEYWKVGGMFTTDADRAPELTAEWDAWIAEGEKEAAAAGGRATGRTIRQRNAWLGKCSAFAAELIEINGEKFDPKTAEVALEASTAAGFELIERKEVDDPKGRGPAATRTTLVGGLGTPPEFRVREIQTKSTTSRPAPPFITSTLQQAAANTMSFAAQTTMRTAQQLYEGVELGGEGAVGLITYMRTDSTHVSGVALDMARNYIKTLGDEYLPEKPNFYKSSNKEAQEAHEAIRPTDIRLTPDDPELKKSLTDQQLKLYRLIWQRFVACQMNPAKWESTTVKIDAKAEGKTLTFKTSGRTLVFDGFYKVTGMPTGDDAILPALAEGDVVHPVKIDPQQKFTSPPPRYSEASLVKTLESEGIGRPSTYASIIQVIQNRKFVEKMNGRFHCTDLGIVVTDKLIEGFPVMMDLGYTRRMEAQLDKIENEHLDWVEMLRQFYERFSADLEKAHELMVHAKIETDPAPHTCPQCGSGTVYRFGRNGRFLSCDSYPTCKYGAPIDRDGNPMEPETTDVACPRCGEAMMKRTGRFGPFLSCQKYPECKGIVNLDKNGHVKHPAAPPLETDIPCGKCDKMMNLRNGKRGPWLSCAGFPKCRGRVGWTKLDEADQKKWETVLKKHEDENTPSKILKVDGEVVPEEYTPSGGADDAANVETGSNAVDAA